uniref:Uncharacterized protein n=1 Tax=Haemonchus contortus TaxID=6289 RepID=A0A7I4YTN3_HAECO
MFWRVAVVCAILALYRIDLSESISDNEAKNFLNKLFEASSKENINKIFSVETKDGQLILESDDAKALMSREGTPPHTVEFVLGSNDDKGASEAVAEVEGGSIESQSLRR